MTVGDGVFIIIGVVIIVNEVITARRDFAHQIDMGGANP